MSDTPVFLKNEGYCCCCESQVVFTATTSWLRDNYLCGTCGCIPRERALMHCIETLFPDWQTYAIYEPAPIPRGASLRLQQKARSYVTSQCDPAFALGALHPDGFLNQDLENLTFADGTFDLVVTQDVCEHIFHPERAFAEIARVLKKGGTHAFTVPLINKQSPTAVMAQKNADGSVALLAPAEYHGNPISDQGSLVTRHWGYDISDFIFRHSGLYTTICTIDRIDLGIRAEYIDVLISRKF
jgi:SAM-dependent methyltransferase